MSGEHQLRPRRRVPVTGPAPKRLTGIELHEVSVVNGPANTGSRHILAKIEDGPPAEGGGDPAYDEVADLRARIAASEAARAAADEARADTETALGVLTERLLALTPAPVAPDAPTTPEAPAAPARTAWEQQDVNFAGLAIIAAATPDKGSRAFWRAQIDALGRHLAPDLPPTKQMALALDDGRGQAFVEALQSRP